MKRNNEEFGRIFEMAICRVFNINYLRNFKYNMNEADKIQKRIYRLKEVFPYNLEHTDNKYDFVDRQNKKYLSAKTTISKSSKVCPQIIGQTTSKKFCEYFNLDILSSVNDIKKFIENNIRILLNEYMNNTFLCTILYYNKRKDLALLIDINKNIDWLKYNISFTHINKNKIWNESSTIKIDDISIGEFQIHKKRNCIKFRWHFEKILDIFKDYFNIINL
jgi:hypothetical protein